ncbi:(2Fe-2S)-binding protein [Agrobacterium larrymoorei]|uniref:(2Fe-2S)-binding protein n=1 Tax=Agrobacterium larrymoorei TaxID=160699 RepID=UPI001572D803|nr:(2Fe-2S)-binding protein [Agrobacterium larrymoorei]NTJ45331.1 (2Fe-2S)-binding protein [Agrobacterium larrymoorei]
MFRRLREPATKLTIFVDGIAVNGAKGDNVSTVLLCAGIDSFRNTSVTGAARGPYCGMGVCFDCLVTIDGEGNRQACLTPIYEGMVVTTGAGRRALLTESIK